MLLVLTMSFCVKGKFLSVKQTRKTMTTIEIFSLTMARMRVIYGTRLTYFIFFYGCAPFTEHQTPYLAMENTKAD